MNKIIFIILVIMFFVFCTSKVEAQVVVNEVSPASDPEWVEIYNIGSDPVSLKNYSINFGSDSQNKFFCDTETILGNSFKIISLSIHWLADSSDVVTLKNGDDAIDTVSYGTGHTLKSPTSGGSISRSPDGGSSWVLLTSSTQIGDLVSFDCPTPIPSPSPAPTPIPTTSKATYKINISKDSSGTDLSSVQIYIDGNYIHHEDSEILEFFPGHECFSGVLCNFGDHTVGLKKDGYSSWEDFRNFQAGVNLEVSPVLTKQVVITASPSPTPSPAPVHTPIPTPAKTSTPSPLDTENDFNNPSNFSDILGVHDERTPPDSPVASEPGKVDDKFPTIAVGCIVLGVSFIGFSIFSIIKSAKKSYTIESEKENNKIS